MNMVSTSNVDGEYVVDRKNDGNKLLLLEEVLLWFGSHGHRQTY